MKKIFTVILLLCTLFLSACNNTISNNTDTNLQDTNAITDKESEEVTSNADSTEQDPRQGTAVNVDSDAGYYLLKAFGNSTDNLEENCITWFKNKYSDCGISDILYNLNTLSDVWDDCIDYHNRGETSSFTPIVEAYYKIYTETKVDPFKVWIDECKKEGINPWISVRMNDVHYANEATGHSSFFYTAQKNGWMIGNGRISYWGNKNSTTIGSRFWYQYALNYAIPEVRQYFLDYIDEQLGKYDVYGVELDWQRTIWCFPTDSLDNCQYMNTFMKDLNTIVAKHEKNYGHKIKIMARINRDIDENKYFGFDVLQWAQYDWIDVVTPSSYWGSSDHDMPIAEWKEKLNGYNVEVWAGLECDTIKNGIYQSVETLAGQTLAYLYNGADKMYLYNLFNDVKAKFKVCSSIENASKSAKRSYVVTENNCVPDNNQFVKYDPLPMNAVVNAKTTPIVIHHGTLNANQDTMLYIGIQGVEESDLDDYTMDVYYNNKKCTFKGSSIKSFLKESTAYGIIVCYSIPKDAVKDATEGSIVFDVGMNLTITYVELMNGNSRI